MRTELRTGSARHRVWWGSNIIVILGQPATDDGIAKKPEKKSPFFILCETVNPKSTTSIFLLAFCIFFFFVSGFGVLDFALGEADAVGCLARQWYVVGG